MFLICGDFNISALPVTEELKQMILKFKPEYEFLLELFDAEYQQLTDKLTISKQHHLIDIARTHNDNVSPITIVSSNIYRGRPFKLPLINMCLDYIFLKLPKE